jgi:hypothetical protein
LCEGGGSDHQSGERRQDEFLHRFTSWMFCSYRDNGEADRSTPFNHDFVLEIETAGVPRRRRVSCRKSRRE